MNSLRWQTLGLSDLFGVVKLSVNDDGNAIWQDS